MDIAILKKDELQEIRNFCQLIEEYGHIFLMEPHLLDEPFNKILEGIKEIEQMMDDSFSM